MNTRIPTRMRMVMLGIATGLVFLIVALRDVNLSAALTELAQSGPQWILPIVSCAILFIFFKSWRWKMLLGPALLETNARAGHEVFGILHRATYAGTAANLVIAHTGELLRSVLIASRSPIAPSAVLASIALERIFDFVALLILIGLAVLFEPTISTVLWSAAILSLVLIGFGLLVLNSLVGVEHARIGAVSAVFLRVIPERFSNRLLAAINSSQIGLGAIYNPSLLLKVLTLSIVQWLHIVAAIWLCMAAVGIHISMSAAIAVFVLSVIGLTLPSSPAQLGTVQLAFVAGLATANISATSAIAASMLYTGLVNGTMILIGAFCWAFWTKKEIPSTRTEENLRSNYLR